MTAHLPFEACEYSATCTKADEAIVVRPGTTPALVGSRPTFLRIALGVNALVAALGLALVDGRLTFVNRAFCTMMGANMPAQLLGRQREAMAEHIAHRIELERRLVANVAVYYMDWTDIQISIDNPTRFRMNITKPVITLTSDGKYITSTRPEQKSTEIKPMDTSTIDTIFKGPSSSDVPTSLNSTKRVLTRL